MNSSERRHFSQMMMDMAAQYFKSLSEALIDIYWVSLKDFELEAIRDALKRHRGDTQAFLSFPKPSEIVRLIEGCSERRALQAWRKVEQAFLERGRYQSLVFDDVLIHAVIEDMGGWIKLCDMRLKGLPFAAQAFQKCYQDFLKEDSTQIASYLLDRAIDPNAKDDHPMHPSVLLRDPYPMQALNPKKLPESLGAHEDPLIRRLIKAVFKAQQQPEDPDEKN